MPRLATASMLTRECGEILLATQRKATACDIRTALLPRGAPVGLPGDRIEPDGAVEDTLCTRIRRTTDDSCVHQRQPTCKVARHIVIDPLSILLTRAGNIGLRTQYWLLTTLMYIAM